MGSALRGVHFRAAAARPKGLDLILAVVGRVEACERLEPAEVDADNLSVVIPCSGLEQSPQRQFRFVEKAVSTGQPAWIFAAEEVLPTIANLVFKDCRMSGIAWMGLVVLVWTLAAFPAARRAMKVVSTIIGKPPSVLYAVTYFSCIPLFAAIYGQIPNEFYYSTVRYEAVLLQDARDILDDLQREIVARCIEINKSGVLISNGWELDLKTLRLSGLQYSDREIKFNLRFTINNKHKGRMTTNLPNAGFALGSTMWISGNQGSEGANIEQIQVTNFQDIPFDIREIFKANVFGNVRGGQLSISPRLRRRIDDFARAHEGFPGQSAGGSGRMLYLSVVTITTLGFGDIVPISPTARAYTGLQAVLGVLLVGLFLNALSQETSQLTSKAASAGSSLSV